MDNSNKQMITGALIVAVVAIVGVGAYAMLTQPDERSANEHIGDAISKLDEGVDDAARELKDRTPAERIQDEYQDATDGNEN